MRYWQACQSRSEIGEPGSALEVGWTGLPLRGCDNEWAIVAPGRDWQEISE